MWQTAEIYPAVIVKIVKMIKDIIKYIATITAALLITPVAKGQPDTTDMRNLSLPERGRLLSRAKFMTYPKAAIADTASFGSSLYHASLNGEWRFRYFGSNDELPEGYYKPSFDDSKWDTVKVPCSWEEAGIVKPSDGTAPYPFAKKGEKPRLPEKLPVGIYRSTFVVPFDWDERQILLDMERFGAAATVWINGHKAGYAEDPSTQAEFDITRLCVEDVNTIVIESHLYSKGALLEGARTPRTSGLAGDIYIVCQPKVRLSDLIAVTSLDPTYANGMLQLGVVVKSHYLNPKELKVYYECFDADGKSIGKESKYTRLQMRLQDTVYFNLPIRNVHLWNAENPYLYRIRVATQKNDGRYSEFVNATVGFRTSEVSGRELLVDGKAVKIKGVIMREYGADSLAGTLTELKKLGINAILTQPMAPEFYDLCDELGFYVFDQAAIESTGMGEGIYKGQSLANDPQWLASFLYRTENVMQRDKSHPSVTAWSMGYRSGNGYNMYKAYLNLKAKDRTRPVCYGGAGLEWNTDIFCPVNPDSKTLADWAAKGDRPCVIEEYAADTTTFGRVWDIIERKGSGIQGGFMFDAGKLLADSTLQAAVKERFAPVSISRSDSIAEEVIITNECTFLSLDKFDIKWTLTDGNGKRVSSGSLSVPVAPGQSAAVRVTKEGTALPAGKSLTFTLTVRSKEGVKTTDILKLKL